MIDLATIIASYPSQLQQFRRALLREYLQYKILEFAFNSEYRGKLVFIGGTALRIVHGISRFSEDLDFDNFGLTGREFEALAQEIRRGLEGEGYVLETGIIHKGAHRCNFRFLGVLFGNGLSPHEDEKLLIQFDTMAQGYSYVPEQRTIGRLSVFTAVAVPPLPILLSQKIAAALERKRAQGRDFFDIVDLLSRTKPDYEYLRQKLDIKDPQTLRAALIERSASLDFLALARSVSPFLFREADARRIELFPEFIREVEL